MKEKVQFPDPHTIHVPIHQKATPKEIGDAIAKALKSKVTNLRPLEKDEFVIHVKFVSPPHG